MARPKRTPSPLDHRPYRPMLWLLPLLLLGALAALHLASSDDRSERDKVALGPPEGPRTLHRDLCIVELIDQSSSMTASDPERLRATAVGALGSWLARYGRPGDREGVVWFANTTKSFPPVVVRGDPGAVASMAIDPGESLGGGTAMAEAVKQTDRMIRRCPTGSQAVLVAVTDGLADDFGAVRTVIEHLPSGTHVHLVAMDTDGAYTSTARSFWEEPALGLRSVQRVRTVDASGVTDPIAWILSVETGQRVAQAP